MKAYKTAKKMEQVRKAVKKVKEYSRAHVGWGRHLSSDEFTSDVMHICSLPTYNLARKVAWIVRADGSRDSEALKVWGFNKHTA